MTQPAGEPVVVKVPLGDRSYEIHIGDGLLGQAGRILAPTLVRPRTAIVTDETVAGLHLPTLVASLEAAGLSHETLTLPPGEATKDIATVERALDWMLEAGIERTDTVLALGGGVIGDVAGFAASILRRGVRFIQLPTTLLAQVDSAIGGKVGINTRHGKNLVGSFHQPQLVLSDVSVLDTLPERELRAGYAEIVKYGLLGDEEFFGWLESHAVAVLDGEATARQEAIARSCRAKARIVAADERESGERALLNLGHTFAHALEAEAGYGGALLHGEAVAIGLVMAFDMSARLGLCPAGDALRVRDHLHGLGLPTSPREAGLEGWNTTRLVEHMQQDKKVRGSKLTFVLAHGIGRAFLNREVDAQDVQAVLEGALAA